MKKHVSISRETLRAISEEVAEVKIDEEEWDGILMRVGDLFSSTKGLEEVELDGVQPAFSYDPGGGRNGKD